MTERPEPGMLFEAAGVRLYLVVAVVRDKRAMPNKKHVQSAQCDVAYEMSAEDMEWSNHWHDRV